MPKVRHTAAVDVEQIEWSKSARDEAGEWDYAEVRRTAAMRWRRAITTSTTATARGGAERDRPLRRAEPRAAKENVGFHWNALHDELGRARGAVSARKAIAGAATSAR